MYLTPLNPALKMASYMRRICEHAHTEKQKATNRALFGLQALAFKKTREDAYSHKKSSAG